ncbi:hypothetical protein AB0I69_36140 [Streptomyces sp. NPDC050508]|uniref:hypothetical protein n=1 Tax=Streptomyces sp. NPDC050508 TaxID=3155405 RepID=UPI003421145D
MDEVLPQLNELLFPSVEGVLVESVEVIDTVVRAEARTTAGRAVVAARLRAADQALPLGGAITRLLLASRDASQRAKCVHVSFEEGFPAARGEDPSLHFT